MPAAHYLAGCLDTPKFMNILLDLTLKIQCPKKQQLHLAFENQTELRGTNNQRFYFYNWFRLISFLL
jgi:hypothetical protein